MANLGSIGMYRKLRYVQRIPLWKGASWTTAYYLATPVNGVISGVVEENGVVLAGVKVRMYYRPTGILIAQVISGAGGAFSFDGLDPTDTGGYYVLAIDPDGGDVYDIPVHDRITPRIERCAVAYIPPVGNAVILEFVGAYTSPLGDSVILDFISVFTSEEIVQVNVVCSLESVSEIAGAVFNELMKNMLDVYLRAQDVPTAFYLALFNDTPVEGDTLDDLIGEPVGNGYLRMVIERSVVGWPSLITATGDYVAFSKEVSFLSSGAGWGPVTCLVLTDTPSGDGKLFGYRILESPVSRSLGDSFPCTVAIKLR